MAQSAEEWKQKFYDSLAELEQREKSWQQTDSTLRRCISRLTLIGDGSAEALNRRLEDLRNQVRSEKDVDRLLGIIDTITRLAEQKDDKSSNAEESNTITPPTESAVRTRPGLLGRLFSKEQNTDTEDKPRTQFQPEKELLEVEAVLLQLLERVVLPVDIQPRVDTLKEKLTGGFKESDLLPVLDELIALMGMAGEKAETERQKVEQFLVQITGRLQELDQTLGNLDEQGQLMLKGSQSLESGVQVKVSEMQDSVASATNIDDLKVSIDEHLALLEARLKEHQGQVQQQERLFEESITDLKSRLQMMERETTGLQKLVNEARAEALTDALTGLNNRHAYDLRIAQEYARWKRYHFDMSLILLDIDHFKKINDNFGHKAGDTVLNVLGGLIKEEVREVDCPARYGGEEFAVLLPETKLADAYSVAEKIRRMIATKGFHSRNLPVTVTTSCGVAQFKQQDTPNTVFERADAALYAAKRDGRDRCYTEEKTISKQ